MSIVARVSVPSKGIFVTQEVDADPTVAGAIAQLELHSIDWNGETVEIRVNGALVGMDHPLVDKDTVLILPDKPTGN
jgi:molybdopterin converting factor small subunit